VTSEKRVLANRANAKRSTGPRTSKGKARASQNATKHGLWRSAPADLSELHLVEHAILGADPDPEMARLAQEIAVADWALRKVLQVEAQLLCCASSRTSADASSAEVHPLAIRFQNSLPELAKLERYERRARSRLRSALTSFEARRGRQG
jgi:hypothetical protein